MERGRPTDYNEQVAAEICEWISAGGSLNSYSKQEGKPDRSTVRRWLTLHEDFYNNYERARRDQTWNWVDEARDVARDESKSSDTRRMEIDVIKWNAMKVIPKVFGDKLDLTVNIDAEKFASASVPALQETCREHGFEFTPAVAATFGRLILERLKEIG